MSINIKDSYTVNCFMAFAIVGLIIKLFFQSGITKDGNSGPANAAIWGYGVVALSIFAVMFISFALASNLSNLNNSSTLGFIKTLLGSSLPCLLTLLILFWMITLNTTYFTRINQGKLSSEYSQFSMITTILLIVQIYVLFSYIKDQAAGKTSSMSTAVYITTFLNIIFISMMNIILKFFSTDG